MRLTEKNCKCGKIHFKQPYGTFFFSLSPTSHPFLAPRSLILHYNIMKYRTSGARGVFSLSLFTPLFFVSMPGFPILSLLFLLPSILSFSLCLRLYLGISLNNTKCLFFLLMCKWLVILVNKECCIRRNWVSKWSKEVIVWETGFQTQVTPSEGLSSCSCQEKRNLQIASPLDHSLVLLFLL